MIVTVLEAVVAFILVLGPLVFIHELGHFLVAKAFGVAVPVFSIGFGPRLAGFRRRETDYRLSLIPLGGYVRMAGDEADEHRSGLPHEFLSKPKWQRFLIFVAGATFNVALAFVAFWAMFAIYGKEEVRFPDQNPTVMSVAEGSPAERAGVRRGDRLLAIGARDVASAEAYREALNFEIFLSPGTTKPVQVERDGELVRLQLEVGEDPSGGHGTLPGWYAVWSGDDLPATVLRVVEGEPADLAGIEAGDRIVGADGRRPIGELDLRQLIEAGAGVPLPVTVERDGRTLELVVTPAERESVGKIGVVFSQLVHRELTLAEAARESWRENLANSKMLFVVLKKIFTNEVPLKSVSGPIGIAQVARRALLADARTFLWLLGFFSLQLGILNLLPIPVLDGGHILILTIEGVLRRDLSDRIKEAVMTVGFVVLLAFMSAVIVSDVMKL